MSNDPRGVVRINQFERALHNFNLEQGQKVTQTLVRYHQEYVEPLEAVVSDLEDRVRMLEVPFWVRVYYRFIQRPSVQRVLRWIVNLRGKDATGPRMEQGEGDSSEGGDLGGVPHVEPSDDAGPAGAPVRAG